MRISGRFIFSVALISAFFSVTSHRAEAQSLVRARVTQPVDLTNRITLRGNIHPLAQSQYDQGPAPDDLPMQRMLMVLQRGADQETALRQLLDQQQVASSSQFHQWLTPEQFGLQFGPADSDIQAVTDWLTSQGFQVAKVAAGRTVIEFSGSAGLVRQALGAEIHKFHVNGQDHWANVTNPQIPAALAPVIAGIESLNNFPRQPMIRQLGTFRRTKATGKVEPLLTIPTTCTNGESGCVYFALGPADFATIYNIPNSMNGSGQTIAVVGETNINMQDVVDFRSMFGLPANNPAIILNGPDPGITGDEPEADLDVQWSGAVAPNATVDFVVSESTETTAGVDLSALYIVDNNLAPVMSESYGSCEAALGTGGNQFYNTLWEQASAEGITVLMASGDSGSAGCDSGNAGETAAEYGLAVSGFASTPFNVAVGGTDFNFNSTNYTNYWLTSTTSASQASAISYIPEETWNESCVASDTGSETSGCNPPPSSTDLDEDLYIYAGGGGPSNCINPTYTETYPGFTCNGGYAKPAWQTGQPTAFQNDGARDVPDVAIFAGSNSFYVMCEMDANAAYGGSSSSCDLNSPYLDFQGGGGTSASVQVFAGIMALVNAAHGRQGNANYVLYPLAVGSNICTSDAAIASGASASNCIFYDVTTGNNSVICAAGSLNCNNINAVPGEYGALVTGSGSSQTLAYFTNSGYDLATGLGSVNVANLVSKWKSTFTTSDTTLTLTPPSGSTLATLVHGQTVNVAIGVTASSGTPSGDVSLIAQTGSYSNGNGGTAIAISPSSTLTGSGTVSGTTAFLPGGSYNVTAHYAGNGTDGASDSSPVAVSVSPENSVTQLNFVTENISTGAIADSNSSPYGYPYVLRMDVTNTTSSGALCAPVNTTSGEQLAPAYPCPTGTVTVTPTPTDLNPPAGTTPGTYKLNSQGYAEDQYINLSPGSYSLKASYSGDNSYNSSTSSTLPLTITPGQTTTTLGSLPSTTLGTSVELSATVSTAFSNGAAPTGSIQFQNNGTTIGTVALSNVVQNTTSTEVYYSGQASLNATLPVGVDNITATYLGDTNYAASAPASSTTTVGDFSVSANPTPITISQPGQSGTSTISVTPEGGLTGTVNLSVTSGCPTGAICTLSPASVTLSGTSAVTSTLTVTTTGSSSNPPPAGRRFPPLSFWTVRILLAALLALAMYVGSRRLRRAAVGLLAVALTMAAVWVACGGGGGGGTTTTPTAPAVTLSPTSLTFASQTTGTTSSAQNVTLSNSGTAALALSGITLTGTNSGDFAQTNACGSSVAAGSNCTIAVTFTPTAAGTRNASVSIADNATGSPQTVGLTGTGATPSTPAGTYTLQVVAADGTDSHSISVSLVVQ